VSGPEVLDIARESVWTLIKIASPMMIVGLAVGVVVALFQALTQIQEMTLVFVPKILAIFFAMMVSMPFVGQVMASFMTRLTDLIIAG